MTQTKQVKENWTMTDYIDKRGADYSFEKMPGRNWRGADLRDVNFCCTDLRGSDLIGSDLRGAILTGADLTGSLLRCVDLRGALIGDAILTDCDLSYSEIEGVDFSDAVR